MKKILYLSVATLGFLTVSCKKDYTCACTYTALQTYTDEDGEDFQEPTTTVTTTSSSFREKEKDAKSKCEGANGDAVQSLNNGGIYMKQTVNTNCKLK